MGKIGRLVKRCGELLAMGAIAGVLITGCGGGSSTATTTTGGGTPTGASGATTAVGGYIADKQGASFTGWWANQTGFVGASASAVAGTTTLAATATANVYVGTYADRQLVNGAWGVTPTANIAPSYDLIPTGWFVSPNTGTLADSGNGSNITLTPTGEPAYGETVTKTSLAGTAIVCTSPATGAVVACATPGNYPAGAASYTLSMGTTQYNLWGMMPVTDATGTALTALPAAGTTVCVPEAFAVFKAIAPAPAAGANNYNVYNTLSCAAADITAALASPVIDTVLISTKSTGNTVVPSVQLLSGATVATWLNNGIMGFRAGNVWVGQMTSAGTTWMEENKIAINAELLANGLVAIP